jgi:hypothetical protein
MKSSEGKSFGGFFYVVHIVCMEDEMSLRMTIDYL